ncbi:hypothetical protein Taro_014426 [Colocasia esculenta]|uniref:Uncharacterized protein n=1 Tax=Colocasia esculenta TaxID=4460 RepID=A0A843UQ39_COLES|nr:hypothetical protein [Colocasia esculenta]
MGHPMFVTISHAVGSTAKSPQPSLLFTSWPGHRGLGAYLLALLFVFILAALVESPYTAHRLASLTRGGGVRGSSVSADAAQTVIHALWVGPFAIWPAIQPNAGSKLLQGGGFELPTLAYHSFPAPVRPVVNNCPFAIWPAIQPNAGSKLLQGGGFELPTLAYHSFPSLASPWSGRI